MKPTQAFVVAFSLLLVACGATDQPAQGVDTAPAGTGTASRSDNGSQGDPRDNWQRPQEVFRAMGGIQGKVVADLFAGDGYIAFHMVKAGAAKVIAVDTDPANIAAMRQKKAELGLDDQRMEIRQVAPGETGLEMNEADLTFMFNRYTTIQDRKSYMQKVRLGTKSPKTVYIIDFLVAETPVGPPVSQRMSDSQMMDELGEYEYSDMGARGDLLPYQYILFAQDYVEGAESEPGPMQEQ
ncbi:MAG: methyltransferase domain-containing protein [Flavobacteriales bacterium]|nr:MAG: methyltransferase domain-containing protein [Flavobacteriales bacterium]